MKVNNYCIRSLSLKSCHQLVCWIVYWMTVISFFFFRNSMNTQLYYGRTVVFNYVMNAPTSINSLIVQNSKYCIIIITSLRDTALLLEGFSAISVCNSIWLVVSIWWNFSMIIHWLDTETCSIWLAAFDLDLSFTRHEYNASFLCEYLDWFWYKTTNMDPVFFYNDCFLEQM